MNYTALNRNDNRGRRWSWVTATLALLIGFSAQAMGSPILRIHKIIPLLKESRSEIARPVAEGETLYLATGEGSLIAYDVTQLRVLWRLDGYEGFEASPLIDPDNDALYAGSIDGRVLCVNRRTGKPIWEQEATGRNSAQPTLDGDRLIIANSRDRLIALDKNDGHWLWEYRRTILGKKATVRGLGRPIVSEGLVIAGFSDATVVALDRISGKLVWETRLGDRRRFEDVDGQPVIAENLIWAADFEGRLAGLDPSGGRVVHSLPQGGHQSILLQNSLIYMADSRPGLYAIDPANPQEKVWDRATDSFYYGFLPVEERFLLTATMDGRIVLLDGSDGLELADYDSDSRFDAAPVRVGDAYAVLSSGGYLYLFTIRGLNR